MNKIAMVTFMIRKAGAMTLSLMILSIRDSA
jgi:hypothetical protein